MFDISYNRDLCHERALRQNIDTKNYSKYSA